MTASPSLARPRPSLALAALALAVVVPTAACGGPEKGGDEPSRTPSRARPREWPRDPEAEAHAAEGERLFAAADDAPEPRAAYAKALAELALAAERVPSPDNRVRRACAQLLAREPDSKVPLVPDPETTLDEVLTEDPDHPSALAIRGWLDASAAEPRDDAAVEKAERACAVAALASDRAVKVFVGDRVAETASLVQRRKPERAVGLMARAADLGSPFALVNMGLLAWTGRGGKVDREKALELGKRAAATAFSPEERGRGLLHDEARYVRLAARAVGHWLVLEASFAAARGYLATGTSVADDAAQADGTANGQFLSAVTELGALEGLGLGGPRDVARARERLDGAAKAGHPAALELLGRLAAEAGEDEKARLLFSEAARTGSLAALGGSGEWGKLAVEARDRSTRAKPSPEKLYELRTALFALAVQDGAAARADAETAARACVEGAPPNEPSARQLRHVAGDLPAEDLQATMPKSALLPRWRAETELALATRCLLLGERDKALEHLQACRDAEAVTQPEDGLAWAALRKLR